jgi:hypothetical protein
MNAPTKLIDAIGKKGNRISANACESEHKFRDVILKEIANSDSAYRQIREYTEKDARENMIRLNDYLVLDDYVQLFLERGICSLPEFLKTYNGANHDVPYMSDDKRDALHSLVGEFHLGNIGSLSPLLLNFIRQIICAVESLHKHGQTHGSLEPEKVIIFPNFTPKISLNYGRKENHPRSENSDLFGLGRIIHYCAMQGKSSGFENGQMSIWPLLSREVYHLVDGLLHNSRCLLFFYA